MKKNSLFTLRLFGLSLYIFLVSVCIVSCTASKSVTRDYVVDQQTDTITLIDTVLVEVQLPPDTVKVEAPKIEGTEKQSEDLKNGLLTISPWFAHSERSYAIAGIRNNVPYLWLYDLSYSSLIKKPITTTSFNNTKTITKTEIKEVVKYKPWFNDIWFYLTVVMTLISIIIIIFKFRK